ncbi:hypothetical protein B0H14DRAFT_3437758 [Mycena olivaceomarginata]|nr:hypothetical protein B0H14DRAFT_3437758 [Mycena olivaceomarginata]
MPPIHDRALQKDEYPALFRNLLSFAMNILKEEHERTGKFSKQSDATSLVSQLTAWAYNREPSRSMTWTSALNALDYWKTATRDSNVKILGAVAIKDFSIMPFEICDERTASRLGRFNSARRASMTPDNLVECASGEAEKCARLE